MVDTPTQRFKARPYPVQGSDSVHIQSEFRRVGTNLDQANDALDQASTAIAQNTTDITTLQANITTLQGALGSIPQGRLTFTSGTPVMNNAVSAGTTVYYTPYLGQYVPVWSPGTSSWVMTALTGGELSQLLTDTTKSPAAAAANSIYDMFVWNDSGTIRCTRGPAWTNATTRSMALVRNTGLLTNGAAITNGPALGFGVYVGTIMTNASGTLTWTTGGAAAGGSPAFISLWNMYNRVGVTAYVQDNNASWTYATAAWRAADNSVNNSVGYVCGQAEDPLQAEFQVTVTASTTAGSLYYAGIGVDSSSSGPSGTRGASGSQAAAAGASYGIARGYYSGIPGIGNHTIFAIEFSTLSTAVTLTGGNAMGLTVTLKY